MKQLFHSCIAHVPLRCIPEQHESGAATKLKETLNQQGAMALARQLERYWHEQGYRMAHFWAEPIKEHFAKVGTYEIHRAVRNLVNELPPRYRDEAR